MKNLIARFMREDEGQDLVEYAMLVALIAVVAVGGVTLFGGQVDTFFTQVAGNIPLDPNP